MTEDDVPEAGPEISRRTPRQMIRDLAGWLVFALLLLLTTGGLIVTLCSRPQQLDTPKDFVRTVPRKIVPVPSSAGQSLWQPPRLPIDQPAEVTALLPPQQTTIALTPMPAPIPAAPVPSRVASLPPVAKKSVPVPEPVLRPLPDAHLASFKSPVIAIVIDDMGLDRRHSAQMAALPAAVTLAFMPYAPQIGTQTAQAAANGHELIVHMPMEPDDLAHNNPGPDALLTRNTQTENIRRLDKNLAAFNGYMGINNHMGSALTADRAAITPVLQDLKARGLWFLDSKTDARSVASLVANEIGLPYASRDVFLDNVNNRAEVLKQLRLTENIARRKGYAIAIGHPKDGTVAALQDWVPAAQAQGFTLVPLSMIIAARFPDAAVPKYARVKMQLHVSQVAQVP